jgi:hypothetical protein
MIAQLQAQIALPHTKYFLVSAAENTGVPLEIPLDVHSMTSCGRACLTFMRRGTAWPSGYIISMYCPPEATRWLMSWTGPVTHHNRAWSAKHRGCKTMGMSLTLATCQQMKTCLTRVIRDSILSGGFLHNMGKTALIETACSWASWNICWRISLLYYFRLCNWQVLKQSHFVHQPTTQIHKQWIIRVSSINVLYIAYFLYISTRKS